MLSRVSQTLNAVTRGVALMFCTLVTADGADIHVSPAGNNGSSGRAEAPVKSIQRGASLAGPGDTVWVHGGVYAERVTLSSKVGTADRPITIRSVPGETAVIDHRTLPVPGGTPALIRLHYCSHVVIQGLELRNFRTGVSGTVPVGIHVTGSGRGVRLIGNKIHGVWHFDPTPYNYDANAHGILVAGDGSAPISDIEIDGNELYDLRLGASEAMVLNGNVDGFIVRNNIIHDANNIGIDFIGFEGTNGNPSLDFARNGVCTQNVVYNIDSRFNPAYGGSFSGGNNDTRGAVGIYADGAFNVTIERNHVYNCNIGIEVGSEHAGRVASRIKVRNNLIRRNHVGGVFLGGYAASVGGASLCSVTHNTIYQNDVVGYGGGQIALQHNISGTTIEHNIIVANGATRQFIQLPNGTGSYAANSIDWNLYAGATVSNGVFMWRGEELNGLGAWRSVAHQDGHSFFVSHPGFTDANALDFTLAPGSPAIDKGDPTFFYDVGEADYFGRVRTHNDRTDIGMSEHGAVKAQGPTVETGEASDVVYNGATISGTIVPGPTGATVWFEYGTTAIYGLKTAVQVLPATEEPVAVTSALSGLKHKKNYHFRIVGNNSTGSNGGYNKRLTTPPMPPPVIVDQPTSVLAAAGESASFSASATGGLPMTVRWRKNAKALSGTAASGVTYTIAKLKLAHAGQYAAAFRNDSATAISNVATLAIVDPLNYATIVNEAATLTLSARAAAPKGTIGYQWLKDGSPLTDTGRISGTHAAKLVVRIAEPGDAGDYRCQITLGTQQRETGITKVAYRPRPVMNPYSGATQTIVSAVVTGQVSAINELIRFSVTGLPPGLVLNTRTGAVSGRPNRGGTYTATFTAHNLAGPSKPLVVVYQVAALPEGSVGTFAGIVERSPSMKQSSLGGALRLNTTSAGVVTGSLTFGTGSYPFAKRLDTSLDHPPVLQVAINRRGAPGLALTVAFDNGTGAVSGSITAPAEPQAGAVPFRLVWQGPPTRNLTASGASGRYTTLMEPDAAVLGNLAYPQGKGFLTVIVSKTGTVGAVGKLADNSVITRSTILGVTEDWPLHQLTHKGLGSFSGWGKLDGTTRLISGSPSWLKRSPARPTGAIYGSGIPLHSLHLTGSRWTRPTKGSGILGLAATPGVIEFRAELLAAAGARIVSQQVTLNTLHFAEIPKDELLNPIELKLALNPITGLFTGKFTIVDGETSRKVSFQGAMLAQQARAGGYFMASDITATTAPPMLSYPVTLAVPAN